MGALYWFIRTQTTYEPFVPPVARDQAMFNRDVADAISGLVGGYGVAGQLTAMATADALPGHLLCNGAGVARLTFPELFGKIGISFGAGNGTTTFNLPSLAQLTASIATPPPAPPQVISGGGVSSGEPPVVGEVGVGTGGEVDSGGRVRQLNGQPEL